MHAHAITARSGVWGGGEGANRRPAERGSATRVRRIGSDDAELGLGEKGNKTISEGRLLAADRGLTK
jgi:hypothetical protein